MIFYSSLVPQIINGTYFHILQGKTPFITHQFQKIIGRHETLSNYRQKPLIVLCM